MSTEKEKKQNKVSDGISCDSNSLRLSAVIMASGHSKRFGSNKLLADFLGKPLIEHLFEVIPAGLFERVLVVSIYDEVLSLAEKYGFTPVFNPDTTDDTAETIRLGLTGLDKKSSGCVFFTGDQPGLSTDTIIKLAETFMEDRTKICLPSFRGRRGNPVIFPSSFYADLSSLPPGEKGSLVIKAHPDYVREVEISDSVDLEDADYPEELKRITDILRSYSY